MWLHYIILQVFCAKPIRRSSQIASRHMTLSRHAVRCKRVQDAPAVNANANPLKNLQHPSSL